MVENPQTTVLVRSQEKGEKVDPDTLAEDLIDSEVIVFRQKPLTSSIRSTIQYLQSRGGFRARWRGLSAIAVWGLGYAYFKVMLTNLWAPLDSYHDYTFIMLAPALAAVVSRLFMSRLGLTWTHIVISAPSTKSWYARIPSRKAWKQIAMPTLLTAVLWQCNFLVPAIVATVLDLEQGFQTLDEDNAGCNAVKVLAVGAIAFIWFLGISVPAEVALTRVQASMLPEEDESIVAFDRSFNGAVEPALVGGSGKLGYVQAWQTFDRSARLNLLKLGAKVVMIDVALHVLVGLTVVMELAAIMGPQLDRAFAYRPADKSQDQWEAIALGS